MTSTTGVILSPPVYYSHGAFWRALESWPDYAQTGLTPQRSWEDGGIEQRVIRTAAPWTGSIHTYADIEDAWFALGEQEHAAVGLYWRDGLRNVRRVSLVLRRDMTAVRTLIWDGTEQMIARLCGLTPSQAHAEARLYRERFPMRRVR